MIPVSFQRHLFSHSWRLHLQVIPAGQTAMFPITLKCASSRPLHHDVDIVVNGNHFLHFTVQADIVDPTVKLSHADMDFLLSAQDWLSHCDKLLLMENSQPVGCSYEWCNPMPGVFSVAPMFGHIPPYSSAEALIRWTPPPDSVSQGLLSPISTDLLAFGIPWLVFTSWNFQGAKSSTAILL